VPGGVVVGDVVEVGVITVVVVELVVVVLLPSSVPHPVARGSTATPAIRPIQAECLRHDARDCGRMLVSAVNLMVVFASLSAVVAVFPEIETSNPRWLNWRLASAGWPLDADCTTAPRNYRAAGQSGPPSAPTRPRLSGQYVTKSNGYERSPTTSVKRRADVDAGVCFLVALCGDEGQAGGVVESSEIGCAARPVASTVILGRYAFEAEMTRQ
jgi:hypothetical protein